MNPEQYRNLANKWWLPRAIRQALETAALDAEDLLETNRLWESERRENNRLHENLSKSFKMFGELDEKYSQMARRAERAEELYDGVAENRDYCVYMARDALICWRDTVEDPGSREIVQNVIDDLEQQIEGIGSGQHTGAERLSLWFGQSYAAWAVLPRVAMQAMPDRWQLRAASLLDEFNAEFPNLPVTDFLVRAQGERGRMAKLPDELTNYRHPDKSAIDKWRRK